jgi:succinate dehydrogenase / fumarate reductase, membrane anchor subunit
MVNRIVVGAHYGLNDWLAQRITGAVIAVYAIALGVTLAVVRPATYSDWNSLFSAGWLRIATLLLAGALAWHAWIGLRDVLMDYIKATGIRLLLEVLVILCLATYIGWTIEILWR